MDGLLSTPSQPIIGLVKSYDAERGFGFVMPEGVEGDAFLHAATLARDGVSGVTQGSRLRLLLQEGDRGLFVSKVFGTETPPENAEPVTSVGHVKFYDSKRGYGFIRGQAGQDVFVGSKLLRRLGIEAPLRDGWPVRFSAIAGRRGLIAETVTLLSADVTV